MRSTNCVPGRPAYFWEHHVTRYGADPRYGVMEVDVRRQSDGCDVFTIYASDWDDAARQARRAIDRLEQETISGRAM